MTAPTLEDVVTAIKARLQTINGLYVYDHMPAVPNLPAVIIVPPAIDYRAAMRAGVITLPFKLRLLGSTAAGHEAQKGLWRYLDWSGTYSIMQAFETVPTLGIVGADGQPRVDAKVFKSDEPELVQVETFQAFGVDLDLLAIVTNKE